MWLQTWRDKTDESHTLKKREDRDLILTAPVNEERGVGVVFKRKGHKRGRAT